MDNNQLQKNIYQVPPSPSGESLSGSAEVIVEPLSDTEVKHRFAAIEHEELSIAFNQITQDLEMSASGFEIRTVPEVSLNPPHPVALELLRIAQLLQERRARHLASLLKRVEEMGRFGRTKVRLTAKNPSAILRPTLETIIDQESQLGIELFEHDPDVTAIQYFLHDDEWFHEQQSPIPTKKFTNKYEVTESTIFKSSSFYNPHIGSVVTRTVVVDEIEARNLLIASKKYYEKVTGGVYIKPPAPRLRFGSKNK